MAWVDLLCNKFVKFELNFSLEVSVVSLLDLRDGLARVESLWADLCAVHDGLAPVELEGLVQLLQSLIRGLVSAIDDPPVGLEEDGGTEVLVRVPPVGWA